MKIQGALFVGLLCVSLSTKLGFASPPQKPLPRSSPMRLQLLSSYQESGEALTTDLVGKLDPQLKNPHLSRWVVGRKVELKGLKVIPLSEGTYGLTAQAVSSLSTSYVRAMGPWFQSMSHFPCTSEATDWFSTPEGAKLAALQAAEAWSQALSKNLHLLSVRLSQVKVQTAQTAQSRGEMIFQGWLNQLDHHWRSHSLVEAKKAEWGFYTEKAKADRLCSRQAGTPRIQIPSLQSMMEPLSGSPPQWNQILARAPARLWNGLFSVRLNLTLAGKKLNGRFLIDSTAPRSVISPLWLESQGIYPAWILIPDAQPERVSWSGLWSDQMPLSRLIQADQVELSGLKLPLQEFLLADTDFFSPPENLGSCCDGVLGVDFLRLYPIEFQSRSPAEIRVWPRDQFLWSADTPWIEVSETQEGNLISHCELFEKLDPHAAPASIPESSSKNAKASAVVSNGSELKARSKLIGVRWDTGIEHSLQIHVPWQHSISARAKSHGLQIQCDAWMLAQGVQPQNAQPPEGVSPQGLLAQKYPAANLGMNLLGQSSFTLDLPHGRIWFERKSLPLALRKNQSGLILKFHQEDGERQLRVEGVRPHSMMSSFSKSGLRPGTVLMELNDTPADELDLWQVNRILAGTQGNLIKLKWRYQKQIKEASVDLSK